MLRRFSIQRCIAGITAILFILNSVVPNSWAKNFGTENKSRASGSIQKFENLAGISLPKNLGKIQEFYQGTKNQTVILVQDAHAIQSAQQKIRELIDYFQTHYGTSFVGFEGSDSALDTQIFKSVPDPEKLSQVFQSYFNRGELSGVISAALFNEGEAVYQGLENWELYEKGLGLYLAALEKQAAMLSDLDKQSEALARLKSEKYSPKLLEFDRAVNDFEDQKIDLISILKIASAILSPQDPEIAVLVKEINDAPVPDRLEQEIKKAAKTLEKFIKKSNSGAKSRQDLKEFSEQSQAYQTSQITGKAYIHFLHQKAEALGLNLGLSGGMLRAVNHQASLHAVQGTRLYQNLEIYFAQVKDKLIENEEQRKLEKRSREWLLKKKLARLELSREEWRFLKGHSELRDFEANQSFYENAEARDAALYRSLMEGADKNGAKSALMIAGGFHTEGLLTQLKEDDVSYLLIMPAIDSIGESHYQEQMRGQVSWSRYFEVEDGQLNIFKAFVRAVRDDLIKIQSENRGIFIKKWRDQLIRDLAAQEKLTEAGKYTAFLDEAAEGKSIAIAERDAKVEQFIQQLESLEASGRLNEQNILSLLKTATIQSGTAVLANGVGRAGFVTVAVENGAAFLRPSSQLLESAGRQELRAQFNLDNLLVSSDNGRLVVNDQNGNRFEAGTLQDLQRGLRRAGVHTVLDGRDRIRIANSEPIHFLDAPKIRQALFASQGRSDGDSTSSLKLRIAAFGKSIEQLTKENLAAQSLLDAVFTYIASDTHQPLIRIVNFNRQLANKDLEKFVYTIRKRLDDKARALLFDIAAEADLVNPDGSLRAELRAVTEGIMIEDREQAMAQRRATPSDQLGAWWKEMRSMEAMRLYYRQQGGLMGWAYEGYYWLRRARLMRLIIDAENSGLRDPSLETPDKLQNFTTEISRLIHYKGLAIPSDLYSEFQSGDRESLSAKVDALRLFLQQNRIEVPSQLASPALIPSNQDDSTVFSPLILFVSEFLADEKYFPAAKDTPSDIARRSQELDQAISLAAVNYELAKGGLQGFQGNQEYRIAYALSRLKRLQNIQESIRAVQGIRSELRNASFPGRVLPNAESGNPRFVLEGLIADLSRTNGRPVKLAGFMPEGAVLLEIADAVRSGADLEVTLRESFNRQGMPIGNLEITSVARRDSVSAARAELREALDQIRSANAGALFEAGLRWLERTKQFSASDIAALRERRTTATSGTALAFLLQRLFRGHSDFSEIAASQSLRVISLTDPSAADFWKSIQARPEVAALFPEGRPNENDVIIFPRGISGKAEPVIERGVTAVRFKAGSKAEEDVIFMEGSSGPALLRFDSSGAQPRVAVEKISNVVSQQTGNSTDGYVQRIQYTNALGQSSILEIPLTAADAVRAELRFSVQGSQFVDTPNFSGILSVLVLEAAFGTITVSLPLQELVSLTGKDFDGGVLRYTVELNVGYALEDRGRPPVGELKIVLDKAGRLLPMTEGTEVSMFSYDGTVGRLLRALVRFNERKIWGKGNDSFSPSETRRAAAMKVDRRTELRGTAAVADLDSAVKMLMGLDPEAHGQLDRYLRTLAEAQERGVEPELTGNLASIDLAMEGLFTPEMSANERLDLAVEAVTEFRMRQTAIQAEAERLAAAVGEQLNADQGNIFERYYAAIADAVDFQREPVFEGDASLIHALIQGLLNAEIKGSLEDLTVYRFFLDQLRTGLMARSELRGIADDLSAALKADKIKTLGQKKLRQMGASEQAVAESGAYRFAANYQFIRSTDRQDTLEQGAPDWQHRISIEVSRKNGDPLGDRLGEEAAVALRQAGLKLSVTDQRGGKSERAQKEPLIEKRNNGNVTLTFDIEDGWFALNYPLVISSKVSAAEGRSLIALASDIPQLFEALDRMDSIPGSTQDYNAFNQRLLIARVAGANVLMQTAYSLGGRRGMLEMLAAEGITGGLGLRDKVADLLIAQEGFGVPRTWAGIVKAAEGETPQALARTLELNLEWISRVPGYSKSTFLTAVEAAYARLGRQAIDHEGIQSALLEVLETNRAALLNGRTTLEAALASASRTELRKNAASESASLGEGIFLLSENMEYLDEFIRMITNNEARLIEGVKTKTLESLRSANGTQNDYILAIRDGKLTGFVTYAINYQDSEVSVFDIYTLRQREGVGTQLWEAARQHGINQGAKSFIIKAVLEKARDFWDAILASERSRGSRIENIGGINFRVTPLLPKSSNDAQKALTESKRLAEMDRQFGWDDSSRRFLDSIAARVKAIRSGQLSRVMTADLEVMVSGLIHPDSATRETAERGIRLLNEQDFGRIDSAVTELQRTMQQADIDKALQRVRELRPELRGAVRLSDAALNATWQKFDLVLEAFRNGEGQLPDLFAQQGFELVEPGMENYEPGDVLLPTAHGESMPTLVVVDHQNEQVTVSRRDFDSTSMERVPVRNAATGGTAEQTLETHSPDSIRTTLKAWTFHPTQRPELREAMSVLDAVEGKGANAAEAVQIILRSGRVADFAQALRFAAAQRTQAEQEVRQQLRDQLIASLEQPGLESDLKVIIGIAAADGEDSFLSNFARAARANMSLIGSVAAFGGAERVSRALGVENRNLVRNLSAGDLAKPGFDEGEQAAVPTAISGTADLARIAAEIIPVIGELDGIDDPLVVDDVQLIQGVAIVHMARLIRLNPSLARNHTELKSELLKVLSFIQIEGLDLSSIINQAGRGFGISGQMARVAIEQAARILTERAA